MLPAFEIQLNIVFAGCVIFFMGISAQVKKLGVLKTSAKLVDPLQEPDVLKTFRLENQQQCQRLCWYWKTCGRYSFYSKNDNRADNCVLHKGKRNHGEEKLVDGWIDEEPSGRNLSPDHGCASRPCWEQQMCVPVYSHIRYLCVDMSSGNSLGESCTTTCSSALQAADDSSVACIHGQCMCAAGYFYSETQRTCLANCTKLGHNYVRYEQYNLMYKVWEATANLPATDLTKCKEWCNSDPRCLVIVHFKPLNMCFFRYYTALHHPSFWVPYSVADSYQRTCLD